MAPIAASTRRTTYNPVVATTNFPVGFPIFDNADLELLLDGEPHAFTVTATYVEGVSTNAVCVVSPGITGAVEVIGMRTPRRTDQYNNGAPLPTRDHNYSLNRLTIESQEARRDVDRAWKAAQGVEGGQITAGGNGELPKFDADGNLVGSGVDGPTVEQVAAISDEIQTVAGIQAQVQAVAANEANIDAVAANGANITAVANNEANINAAVGNAANINAVVANEANINAVAANEANIDTAAENMPAIIAAPAAAAAAAASVAALPYGFSTATADADPGAGIFRLNHASPASATAAFIDNTDGDGVASTAILDSWDDAVAVTRGTLTIRSRANATIRHAFNVTGDVVEGTGYRKFTLAYVGGNGVLSNATPCWLIFNRSGNDGAGDVAGPPVTTNNGLARWDGTDGTKLKDGGTIGTADIGDGQVTPAKLDNGAAVSILGRSANSSGVRADIAASTNDRILARVSNALSWVQITIGMIPDALITYAKIASAAIAAAADLRAGTASKLVDAATVHSSMGWVALTAGAAPAVDHAAGFNRTITHSANANISAPSNAKPGMPLNFDITPSGFTTSWHGNYKFGASGAPSITARRVVHFICRDSSTYVYLGSSDPS